MPVTIAASGYHNKAFGGTSASFSYTHPGGPLAVFVVQRTQSASGVTANGTTMTASGSVNVGGACCIQRYILDDIASFTANIVVTYTADAYYGGVHVISLAGATGTPWSGTVVTNLVLNGTTPTINVTSATGELVLALITHRDTTYTFTNGTGQTIVREDLGTNGTDDTLKQRLALVTEPGATTVTVDGTISSNTEAAALGFSVAPSGGGGSSLPAISSGYHQRGLR